jgi:putative transposase
MLCLRISSEDEEASPPESRTGLQGEDRIYPYLLRGLTINRPNHVWATDISYIPMARGFVYLTAVMDWFTRRILARRLSNTMEASFCIDAVEEALAKHGCPQIFNTDQGSQFTNTEFTSVLINNAISISMDGKGAWRDNVFVERFWRTIKYEEVYLRAYGASKKHGNQSAATSPSTTQGDFTQPLTAAPRIKPTLTRCRSARQHNPRPTIHLTTRRGGSQCRGR